MEKMEALLKRVRVSFKLFVGYRVRRMWMRDPYRHYPSELFSLTLPTAISQLRPETDFSVELGPPIKRDSWKDEPVSSVSASASGKNAATRSLPPLNPFSMLPPLAGTRKTSLTSLAAVSDEDDDSASSDEDDPRNQIIQSMGRLTLFDKEPQVKASRLLDAAYRFHGRSTNFELILATREMRTKYLLETMGVDVDTVAIEVGRHRESGNEHVRAFEEGLRRREYWHSPDVSIRSCWCLPPHRNPFTLL
jgi:hypothetical protein